MKKALLTTLILGSAATAMAAPMANFAGSAVELGAGVSQTDVKNSNLDKETKGDISLRGNYNFDYGRNWIGGVEAAYKPLSRTVGSNAAGRTKQKYDLSASYIQGYRVAPDAMLYGKVGYHYGRFENAAGNEKGMNGLGYGLGAKYAVTPNVEVGAEWEQTRYKDGGDKATNNSYMATLGYRF